MSQLQLSEQEQLRRKSLIQLRTLGIDPFPAAMYDINTSSEKIKSEYKEEEKNLQDVQVAGRDILDDRTG